MGDTRTRGGVTMAQPVSTVTRGSAVAGCHGAGNEWRATVEPGTERTIAGRFAREARKHYGFDADDAFGRRIVYPSSGVA